jgi:filamentous hemagglutinin family protein
LLALLLCALPQFASANPTGGVVAAGSANIVTSAKKVDINQQSNKAVIDWRGFDIAPDETTAFHQPSASSLTLNRVNSGSASNINGTLTANGNIVIVNQNGVIFGSGAKVDVNGIIASTADISNDKFMNTNGKLVFDQAGNPNAQIINNGTITAKDAGLVGLVAPSVINNGMIVARLGKVTLASGDTTTVDLYGDSLMEVAVSDKVQAQLVGNTGTIKANGGKVALISAAAAREVVDSLTNTGLVQANSVAEKDGEIIISASKVTNTSTGVISAQGDNAGENGGKVMIVAKTLQQNGAIKVDASKQAGTVAITATESVKQNGSITATGETGGKVVINTKTLEQAGTIDVSGQKQGGKINIIATDVKQTGNLIATGEIAGKVNITATTIEQTGSINVDGQTQAGSVNIQATTTYNDAPTTKISARGTGSNGIGGLIHIEAGDIGNATARGEYVTSGNSTGGLIELFAGQDISVLGALLNANGRLGGGIIRIGGDFQGKGNKRRARNTTIDENTILKANATEKGNGGTIIVWSDNNTKYAGKAFARGGTISGDGGLVETSGHNYLTYTGTVIASASNGKAGQWLLDPSDIQITTAASSNTTLPSSGTVTANGAFPNANTVQASTIKSALDGGTSVTITTTNDANRRESAYA